MVNGKKFVSMIFLKKKNHMHVESIDYPLMSFVQKLGVIPKVIDMTGKLWLKIWIKKI